MQFMLSVIDDHTDPGVDDEGVRAAIDEFNDRLKANGQWLFAAGLPEPSRSTTVDNRGEKRVVTDGPFAETKEYLAGFWLLEVNDHATALELAVEASSCCNRKTELRPIHEGA